MGNERRSSGGVGSVFVHVNICDPVVAGGLCLKCWGTIIEIVWLNEEIIQ